MSTRALDVSDAHSPTGSVVTLVRWMPDEQASANSRHSSSVSHGWNAQNVPSLVVGIFSIIRLNKL